MHGQGGSRWRHTPTGSKRLQLTVQWEPWLYKRFHEFIT